MTKNSLVRLSLALSIVCAATIVPAQEVAVTRQRPALRGALLRPDEVTDERIQRLRNADTSAIVVMLEGTSTELRQRQLSAATRIRDSNLELYYWVEVARCPELADAHPQWMASLQGHPEWRRFFPDTATPADDEVVKTYPWVPILSRESYAAQLDRVRQMLTGLPEPTGILLNDLQGAPSACGCGHPLCRWTSDYGQKRSTTPLKEDAAAKFVEAVQEFAPQAAVIPVWTTECEEHDGAKDGLCAGVGCFQGICWQAYTDQLMPLQRTSPRLGVLVPFREFQRDLPIYGPQAGWIGHALESFVTMPPLRGGQPIPATRLVAVLQGWNVDDVDIAAQIQVATGSGAAGYVLAYAKIDQAWEPRVVTWRQPK
jgi:hypothetical protein